MANKLGSNAKEFQESGGQENVRILCLAIGDSNRTFEKIVSSLASRFSEVSVAAWDRTGLKDRSSIIDGVAYYYIMRGWGYKNWTLLIAKPLWVLRLFFYLLRQNPDLIWAATFECALPATLISWIKNIPFIYYIHDNFSISYPFPHLLRLMIEKLDYWIMKKAAAIIVPDENRIQSFAEPFRYKIHILPNTPNGEIAPSFTEIPDRPFTIYATGSIEIGRGLKTLINACARLSGCRILIAGRAPEKELVDFIKSSGEYIDFRGEVSHRTALELYNEADVVFAFYDPSLPIYVLASPTKLYEAMMMGKPVIVNEEAKISAKVRDWGIGYICSYYDENALTDIIDYICHNNTEIINKGKNARDLFYKLFDWRLIEYKLWRVIELAVSSKAPRNSKLKLG